MKRFAIAAALAVLLVAPSMAQAQCGLFGRAFAHRPRLFGAGACGAQAQASACYSAPSYSACYSTPAYAPLYAPPVAVYSTVPAPAPQTVYAAPQVPAKATPAPQAPSKGYPSTSFAPIPYRYRFSQRTNVVASYGP